MKPHVFRLSLATPSSSNAWQPAGAAGLDNEYNQLHTRVRIATSLVEAARIELASADYPQQGGLHA